MAQWPLGRDGAIKLPKDHESEGPVTVTGRYQVFVSPNVKGHTFMIDTETGRVWIMKKDHASGEFSLQRIPVDQVDRDADRKSDPSDPKADKKDTASQKK